jgi:mRNA interferase MazF
MTSYERGDVVLVGFLFADESGVKRRPAVVVSSGEYNRARAEIIIAAVTSNTERMLFGDHNIRDWRKAGLLFPSVATGILRTVKRGMVSRKLGSMSGRDVKAIDRSLRLVLGLE